MKILAILSLALLSACAATPRKFTPPSTTDVHARITETREHIKNAGNDARDAKAAIAKARELGKGNDALILQLDDATGKIDLLTASLLAATTSAADAEARLTAADKKVLSMTDQINKREVKAAIAINRYHRLKLWVCTLGAALVGFLVFRFKTLFLMLGPYGWAAMAAIPATAFGLLWIFL